MKLGVVADIHGNDGALRAGVLGALDDLPGQLRLRLPGGTAVLGVHASPGADDGPDISEEQLGQLLAGCGADVVIGGH